VFPCYSRSLSQSESTPYYLREVQIMESNQSIGVFDDWDQTTTEGTTNTSRNLWTPNLDTLAEPGFQLLKTASEFVQVLKSLSVEGPLPLIGHLVSKDLLGEGGQFIVYRNGIAGQSGVNPWDFTPLAVKKCKIVLGTHQILDLSGPDTRRQIHNMFLEVLVLRDSVICSHRNIVHLLSWAHDSGFNAMPLLVMELAKEDFTAFLKGPLSNSWELKHHICLDMAAGLDAIHERGIIHADFKPENVLIFPNDSKHVPIIAKLSDFGFSEPEARTQSKSMIYITALSQGWQAPEIDLTRPPTPITVENYKKADNYSLGLVVWSVCCFQGRPPSMNTGTEALPAALEMLERLSTLPRPLKLTFDAALGQLLLLDAAQRPESIFQLFRDGSEAYSQW